jgi:hypothetical protein
MAPRFLRQEFAARPLRYVTAVTLPTLLTLVGVAALSAPACDSKDVTATQAASTPPPATAAASTGTETIVKKGEPIPPGPRLPIATVLANPDDYAGKAVTVDGQVQKVCTRAGCWMEISAPTDGAADTGKGAPTATPQSCRVSFNHAFSVPRTSGGDAATVHGTVRSRNISPKMVKHLEEEGGSFSIKLPDGSAREVAIIADGVELRQ